MDGVNIWAYMVLAPANDADEVEHAILVMSEPNNNFTGYPVTLNYTWYALRRYDLVACLEQSVQHRYQFVSGRGFNPPLETYGTSLD